MSPAFNPQVAFQQVVQRLDGLQAAQEQTQQILLQTVDIQTSMLGTQNRMLDTQNRMQDTQNHMLDTQNRMLETQIRMQQDISQLQDSQLTLLRTQNQMLDYMKFTFDQQAKWNERQDQFNIIFLDELRGVKGEVQELKEDVREIKKKISGELEARLIKLEDFMNDQLRKAS